MEANQSPAELREMGKAYFFHSDGDIQKRNMGIRLLLKAHTQKDPEATFYVADFILKDIIKPQNTDPKEHALTLMCSAANNGCIQARAFLNHYCQKQYNEKVNTSLKKMQHDGVLVDFEGKPIHIQRKGVFTPIDAELKYHEGRNILTLSTNIKFLYTEEMENYQAFEQSVLDGILAWQGEYEVFGGQKLIVKLNLTTDERLYDNVIVLPMTAQFSSTLQSISRVIGSKEHKARVDDLITSKRSFATSGAKWTVKSKKIIYIQSMDGKFDDYQEIMHVAKHEFGHALGLGDLYANPVDQLEGVEKGTYMELDSYAIRDKLYNLVMCDHHGPISNNDIEMVVLAFRENKMQLYQPSKLKGKISTALGKGN